MVRYHAELSARRFTKSSKRKTTPKALSVKNRIRKRKQGGSRSNHMVP